MAFAGSPAGQPGWGALTKMPKTNLAAQLLMGLALLIGMMLARREKFRAHGICQAAVVLLNLIPIASFMVPAFRSGVAPGLPQSLGDRYYAVATAHAALGAIAEVLGIYIILVAGTKLLPPGLRFRNYKQWMRTELVLWWLVIALGAGTYWVWYVLPPPSKAANTAGITEKAQPATQSRNQTVTITISNFTFAPKDLQIEAGTTIIWNNSLGRHTVTADDGSFDSPIMASGEEFKHTFSKPGTFPYFCKLHGAAGEQKMSGKIIVR